MIGLGSDNYIINLAFFISDSLFSKKTLRIFFPFIIYDIWMCKIPCEIENIVPRRLHFVDILQESEGIMNYEQKKMSMSMSNFY